MNNKRFSIHTLGCKLNFAESSYISEDLITRGWTMHKKFADAELIIIHACAVTSNAERKTRQTISKAIRENPNAKIALIGCFVDVNKSIPYEDQIEYILANSQKIALGEIIEGNHKSELLQQKFHPAYSLNTRTRSFLKIQDGCDYFCSYCTVAHARGESCSDNIKGVIDNINSIIKRDFKEINFTGVNIGTFGEKNDESFYELLKTVNDKFSNTEIRFRLGSVEPDLLNNEIISIVANSAILMPHFHLPLQSGSDSVLKRMKRRYNSAIFAEKCRKIKKEIPKACIAADVIVGFPGESDTEFQETVQFIEELPISYLHVFSYSDRPLAIASSFPNKVAPEIIKKRSQILLKLSKEKEEIFFRENLGSIHNILLENREKDGKIFGYSDNYILCGLNKKNLSDNTIIKAELSEISQTKEFVFARGDF